MASSKPTQSQSQSQSPRRVIIRLCPYKSAVAQKLTAALDNELAVMYPDHGELPHPGFADWVGGDADEDEESATTAPVLAALDANPDSSGTLDPSDLPPDQIKKMHFHVAFDVTDIPDATVQSHLQNPDSTSTIGDPVACIAVKLMPYFPHHRPQQPSDRPNPVRYGEIKRAYVMPSHRGALVQVFPTTDQAQKLAPALVTTAMQHAKDELHAEKLVLETGIRQAAAVRLYERLGWKRRDDYGDYVGAGLKDGGVCICYEHDL